MSGEPLAWLLAWLLEPTWGWIFVLTLHMTCATEYMARPVWLASDRLGLLLLCLQITRANAEGKALDAEAAAVERASTKVGAAWACASLPDCLLWGHRSLALSFLFFSCCAQGMAKASMLRLL